MNKKERGETKKAPEAKRKSGAVTNGETQPRYSVGFRGRVKMIVNGLSPSTMASPADRSKQPRAQIQFLEKTFDLDSLSETAAGKKVANRLEALVESLDLLKTAEKSAMEDVLLTSSQVRMDELIQLKLRADAKRALLAEFPAVNGKEFFDLLVPKPEDSNAARSLNRLAEQGLVLAVQAYGEKRFPLFQLDANNTVYPRLQETVKKAAHAGISAWNLVFWLLEQQTVILGETLPENPFKEGETVNFDTIAEKLSKTQPPDIKFVSPYQLLATNNSLYDDLEREWFAKVGA